MTIARRTLLAAGLAAPALARAATETEISFYFPIAIGGPVTKIIDGYASAFGRENPDIRVRAVYAGSYVDTLTKAQTAIRAGDQLAMAVLLAVDAFTLIDQNLIVPLDTLGDAKWLDAFYPAFRSNAQIGGHEWGVPFQRSTVVLYWNKAAFRDAGLDPEAPPATWAEHTAMARKATKMNGGAVARWGVEIPSSGFPYWLYQALVTEAGGTLASPDGKRTFFDSPECQAALQYWIDLSAKYHAQPSGIVDWGTTPHDFLEGRAAMIWTTTGNLSFIRAGAKFPFGVAMLPAGKRRGSPTGGGDIYLFKAAPAAQQHAALRFARWLTSPERAAQWCIDTGYVATRPDAWATPALQKYVAGFPAAAVARDQLRYAVPELSTHDNQHVTQALNDGLQAALTGRKPPQAALHEAQATAVRILRPYQ
jgi:sn-glycerol 3-phosphate transport system substrate-binding protein